MRRPPSTLTSCADKRLPTSSRARFRQLESQTRQARISYIQLSRQSRLNPEDAYPQVSTIRVQRRWRGAARA